MAQPSNLPIESPSAKPALDSQRTVIEKFLRYIWRSSDRSHQLAIRDPKTNEFRSLPVSSLEQASTIAIRYSDAGYDVYFAPAGFKTPESRKANSAAGTCCFWLDIDVSEEKAIRGSGYRTSEDALVATIFFCVTVGIPEPTHVVLSGTGLHVYWILDKPIGRELWLFLARKLKGLSRVLHFLADPSRTADIASVLRVPGTLNYKRSPALPVKLLQSSDELIPVAVMADAITEAHDRLIGADPTPPHKGNGPCEDVDTPLLQAILDCLDPDMEYPDWFRVAAALFNHTQGNESAYELFDAWSSKGQKYRGQQETWKKWNSLQPDHPNPVGMATLRMMVELAGYNWDRDVIDVVECARDALVEA